MFDTYPIENSLNKDHDEYLSLKQALANNHNKKYFTMASRKICEKKQYCLAGRSIGLSLSGVPFSSALQ